MLVAVLVFTFFIYHFSLSFTAIVGRHEGSENELWFFSLLYLKLIDISVKIADIRMASRHRLEIDTLSDADHGNEVERFLF